jgi:hypothetical protein
MQIPILIEPVPNNGFRAKSGAPLSLTADGTTPDEAVRNLRAAVVQQLENGKQLRFVDIFPENPWLALAGTHDPKDPFVQGWKKEMEEYRQEIEDDPDRP